MVGLLDFGSWGMFHMIHMWLVIIHIIHVWLVSTCWKGGCFKDCQVIVGSWQTPVGVGPPPLRAQ